MDVKETLLDSISNLINKDNINIVFIETINNYNVNDIEQTDTEQADTEHTDTEHTDTEQADTEQADTEQADTEQSHTIDTVTDYYNRDYTTRYNRSILPHITEPSINHSSYLTPIPPPPLPPPLPPPHLSRIPIHSSNIYRDNRTIRPLFTSISNDNIPYYRQMGSNVIYREETEEAKEASKEEKEEEKEASKEEKEEESKEDEQDDSDYSVMPELISLRDENENYNENNINTGNVSTNSNVNNSSNQSYLESSSINNLQNMIDSILGTIPNIPGELSIEFPINNRLHMTQQSGTELNSIENINNLSYLIPVNEENKETYIHEECSICNINYRKDDIIRKFDRCPHYFHYKCIDRWLNTNKNCPVCTVNII